MTVTCIDIAVSLQMSLPQKVYLPEPALGNGERGLAQPRAKSFDFG